MVRHSSRPHKTIPSSTEDIVSSGSQSLAPTDRGRMATSPGRQ
jgi:hypothetical protein